VSLDLDRRSFLIGLFGAAAVAAAGPIPKVLEALPKQDFIAAIKAVMPNAAEIYGDDKGNYGFATLKYLNEPPYFEVTIPKGFRPLREESDRIGAEAIARITS